MVIKKSSRPVCLLGGNAKTYIHRMADNGNFKEHSQCNENNDSLLHKKKKKLQSIKNGEDWLNMYYLSNNQAQKKTDWIFFQERGWVCKTLH